MPGDDVKTLLEQWRAGDAAARDRLLALVYDDLRQIAAAQFRRQPKGHTLEPTAVVNEVCVRLLDRDEPPPAESRAHLLALLSKVLRQVLLNYNRERGRDKRGGGRGLRLETRLLGEAPASTRLIDLDRAVSRMSTEDSVAAEVLEMKYFGGLTIMEISQALDISTATVERKWTWARAWLLRNLEGP